MGGDGVVIPELRGKVVILMQESRGKEENQEIIKLLLDGLLRV